MSKIKDFFTKLFRKETQKLIEAPKIETIEKEAQDIFREKMIIDNSKESEALKLQRGFREGNINEEDLTEEEFDKLSNLYERQISETKASIENYKKKIINIKNKLQIN